MTITGACTTETFPIKDFSIKSKEQIFKPISEILESVDYNSFLVSKRKYKLVSELTHDLIFSNSFNKVLKLRAIFSWLAFVDPLNVNFQPTEPSSTTLNLLKQNGSYAQAFEALAQHLGIEARCVRGWGKGEDYVVGEGLLARLPNHTWNAVEIEGKWFLIDCFWSRTKDLSDLDDFFFLTDPHQMIHSHFPQEEQWQLLETEAFSAEKFLSLPYLKPEFFKLDLHLDDKHQRFISASNSHCITIHHNGRVGFSFKLISEDRRRDLREFVFQEIHDDRVCYFVRPAKSGIYYLQVFATNVFSGYEEKVITHKSVANFRLEFKKNPVQSLSFPRCSDACWGIPQIYRHLISPRFSSAYIVNPSRKFNFSVHKTSRDEEIYVRTVHPRLDHQSLLTCISIDQSEHKADITFDQPDDSECGLEVYIRKDGTGGKFLFFCQILVTSVDRLSAPHDDPLVVEAKHIKDLKHIKEFQHIKDPMEKLRSIYRAVCNLNVDESSKWLQGQGQDINPSLHMREEALNIHEETWHDDVDIVLKFKKHQATYAEVFEYLCSTSGLRSEMVEGVVKDVDGESKRMTLRPHTWNVVWLQEGAGEGGKDGKKDGAYKGENKAVLVDCCWGARRVIDDSTRSSLISLEDDYYFNPPPEQFIFSHLPSLPAHQLLASPIDSTAFETQTPLKPPFFQHHLSLPQPPPNFHLSVEGGECHLVIFLPPNHNSQLEFSNSLMRYEATEVETNKNKKQQGGEGRGEGEGGGRGGEGEGGGVGGKRGSTGEEGGQVLEGHVVQFLDGDRMHFRVRLPCSGEYRLVLFVKQEGNVFMETLEHLLSYHGDLKHDAFPPASLPTWGGSDFSRLNRIYHKGPYTVTASANGVVDLSFGVDGLMNFKCILRNPQGDIKGGVLVRKFEERLLVSVQCPKQGEYCLELFASDSNHQSGLLASKLPMYLAWQLLIVCPALNSPPFHLFPSFASHFLGPQSANKFFNVCLTGNDDHFFRLSDNSIQLTFTNQRDVRLCGKLFRVTSDDSFEDCSGFVLQQNRELVTTFETTLPSRCMFVFQLFGCESSANNLMNIFNVLLDCTNMPHPPRRFPTQFDHWDGVLHHPLHTNLPLSHQPITFKLQLNRPASAVVLKVNDDMEDFEVTSPTPSTTPSLSFSAPSAALPQTWKLTTSLDKHPLPIDSVEVCACFSRAGGGDDEEEDFATLLEYSVVEAS